MHTFASPEETSIIASGIPIVAAVVLAAVARLLIRPACLR
jgi:hypothetical protein